MTTTNSRYNDGQKNAAATFPPGLVRKLIQFHHQQQSTMTTITANNHDSDAPPPPKRVSNEGALAAGELLRLFVVEIRQRASIIAECEQEAERDTQKPPSHTTIQSNHITQVAAEVLLDFS